MPINMQWKLRLLNAAVASRSHMLAASCSGGFKFSEDCRKPCSLQ